MKLNENFGESKDELLDLPLFREIVESEPDMFVDITLGFLNPNLKKIGGELTALIQYSTVMHGGIHFVKTISAAQTFAGVEDDSPRACWTAIITLLLAKSAVNLNPNTLTLAWRKDEILWEQIQKIHDEHCELKGLPKEDVQSPTFTRKPEVVAASKQASLTEIESFIREDYAILLKHGQQTEKELFFNAWSHPPCLLA